ncbi:hypothetical protein TrVE_jg8450 [Triparma verrucosa]|uniref:RING-type domain-containing protein n=1 Tax=Triparma verrucosa TaxID=1606542 RepID=A0A9W7C2N9_9STRA|nr:hypothetical protein TrVE_jg8450 [Triparma verrucosa]
MKFLPGGGPQQQASQDRCTQCTRLRSNPKCLCEVAEPFPANGMDSGVPSTKPFAMLTIRVLFWARWRRWRKPRVLAAEKIATAWRKHRDALANKIIKFWKNCRMGVRLAALSTQFRTLTAERLEHAARVIQAWWAVRGDIFSDTCCVCYDEKVERILTTTTNTVVSVWVENPCGHKLCRHCAYLCAKRSSKCVLCRRVIDMNFVPSSTPSGLDGTGALIMKPIASILFGKHGMTHPYWGNQASDRNRHLKELIDRSLPEIEFSCSFPLRERVRESFTDMFRELYSEWANGQFTRIKINLDSNYAGANVSKSRLLVASGVMFLPCTLTFFEQGISRRGGESAALVQHVTRFNRVFEEHGGALGVRLLASGEGLSLR